MPRVRLLPFRPSECNPNKSLVRKSSKRSFPNDCREPGVTSNSSLISTKILGTLNSVFLSVGILNKVGISYAFSSANGAEFATHWPAFMQLRRLIVNLRLNQQISVRLL